MRAWFRIVLLLSLVLGLVGCDQVSKSAAKAHLEEAPGYPLVGNALELRYTENRDIGFNALRAIPETSRSLLIRVAGAAALLALGAMLARSRKDFALASALALIFAGAAGNYADRIWRGYVVDFVHLAHWPVFNLADVYITLGALSLAFHAHRGRRRFVTS
jgi:signal peptidase II